MSGINFNELPKNLQQVLSPYIGIAKSVEDAVAIAKENGKWTAEAEKEYTALNGGAAWGKVMDSFDPAKAEVYKKELADAPKKTVDADTVNKLLGLDVKTKSELRSSMKENFHSGKYWDAAKDAYAYQNAPVKAGQANAGTKFFAVSAVLAAAMLLFEACDDTNIVEAPPVTNETYVNTTVHNVQQIDDRSDILFAMQALSDALNTIAELQAQIATNTYNTNEELKNLQAQIKALQEAVDKANSHLVTIITNQENNAATAEEYYKLILGAIGNNTELLQTVVNKLTENNATLDKIKKLMEENNQDNKKILEVITQIKYGVDKLGEDNEQIKQLLLAIEYDIQKNGGKLDALLAIMNVVNQNIEKGNEQQREATEKILAALESIDYNMCWNMVNILNAIKNGNMDVIAKLDEILAMIKVANDNIVEGNKQQKEATEKLLAAIEALNYNMVAGMTDILNAIKNGNKDLLGKVDDIIAMLKIMDKNNEDRNNKVLAAIAQLNGVMTDGFKKLIEIGNKNNALLEKSNATTDEILEVVKKLKGSDNTDILAKLDGIIAAINTQGANLGAKLNDIYKLLQTINKNIEGLDADTKAGFQAVVDAINKKVCGGTVDLSKILEKLDAILAAIKDHKVKIVIEDNRTTCEPDVNYNPDTDEGTRTDLDWLLG